MMIMSAPLYKLIMDDRVGIHWGCISMCFYVVILNKLKLKNGLKCLMAVGFEAEWIRVWHSCDCAAINPVMADDK